MPAKARLPNCWPRRLHRPAESLDRHQHYYPEVGWDRDEFRRIARDGAPKAADRYFQTFFPAAIERLLADYPGHIIDLGAGHTVYEDEALFARVQHMLAPIATWCSSSPLPDLDASVRILRERARETRCQYLPDSGSTTSAAGSRATATSVHPHPHRGPCPADDDTLNRHAGLVG